MGAGTSIQIRWVLALLTLSLLASPASAQQPPPVAPSMATNASQVEELTLEEAVELALRENREVKVSRLELDKFADRLAVAKTHRLPQFNFSVLAVQLLETINFDFKKGDLGTLPGVGPVPAADINVTNPRRLAFYFNGGAFQPVLQQYRLSLVDKKIKTGREIAREELRGKQQEIASNVKKAYYAVLQSQSALQSVEQTLKLYYELDRVTDHFVIEQTALKADSSGGQDACPEDRLRSDDLTRPVGGSEREAQQPDGPRYWHRIPSPPSPGIDPLRGRFACGAQPRSCSAAGIERSAVEGQGR